MIGAAAFFTFGSALGLTAGWATKVSGLVSKLGLTGKLGNVVAGAITQAGYGGLIGGAVGAVTGQGFMRGAAAGMLTGAATGGITGAFQPVGAPGAGAATEAGAVSTATDSASVYGQSAGRPLAQQAPLLSRSFDLSTPVGGGLLSAAQQSTWSKVYNTVVGSGGLGPIIQGVGSGLSQAASERARQKEIETIADSYNVEHRPIVPLFYRSGVGGKLRTRTLAELNAPLEAGA